MERKNIKKYLQSSKTLIIGFIVSIIIIVLSSGSIILKNKKVELKQLELETNAKEFLELEMNSQSVDDLIEKDTYIQVQTVTDYFASKGEEKYYFVSDGLYVFVAQIDEKNFEKLKEIHEYTYSEDENAQAPERVKIYGVTDKIQEDLAKALIAEYNDVVGKEILTEENWVDFVGEAYLKMPEIEEKIELEIFIISLFGALAIIFLSIYISRKISSKNALKKHSENNEVENKSNETENEIK